MGQEDFSTLSEFGAAWNKFVRLLELIAIIRRNAGSFFYLNLMLVETNLQVLESLAAKCSQGCGQGLCRRIIAVVKAAKVLGLAFSEAFKKRPIELLQLLSLKAQDSLEEARLLVETHAMPPASIARILAESFLKACLLLPFLLDCN